MLEKPIIILCGGFGTRLKSVSGETPKSLVKVNGIPFIEIILTNLIRIGFKSFIFSLHYKYDDFIDFIKKLEKKFNDEFKFDYIIEKIPLGTGGAIANVVFEKKIQDNFFVMNGDTWIDGDFKEIIKSKNNTIGLIKVSDSSRFGTVKLDGKGRIIKFCEKENIKQSGLINAGFYKLHKSIFEDCNKKVFSIEKDLFADLSNSQKLYGKILKYEFIDIGIPEDYYRFCKMYQT